jgi:hypothetical protein
MLGFGPISADPISELPRLVVFFTGEGIFRARLLSPVAQLTGDPRVRLVFAVEITVPPILGASNPVFGDEI